MVFAIDAEGCFVSANRAATHAYGMQADQLIGVRQADIHPDRAEAGRILDLVHLDGLADRKPAQLSGGYATLACMSQHAKPQVYHCGAIS